MTPLGWHVTQIYEGDNMQFKDKHKTCIESSGITGAHKQDWEMEECIERTLWQRLMKKPIERRKTKETQYALHIDHTCHQCGSSLIYDKVERRDNDLEKVAKIIG